MKSRVVITVEGGVITSVVSDIKGQEVMILDYDVEGDDDRSDIVRVPQTGGKSRNAYLYGGVKMECDKTYVQRLFGIKRTVFSEIKTEYVDDNGVTHIDGFRSEDENAEGEVIGYFINGEVYWRDPEFQFDPYVIDVVEELKRLN